MSEVCSSADIKTRTRCISPTAVGQICSAHIVCNYREVVQIAQVLNVVGSAHIEHAAPMDKNAAAVTFGDVFSASALRLS